MATYPSYRRSRRTRPADLPRCLDCGELVASPAIVRCGFCTRHHQLTSRHHD